MYSKTKQTPKLRIAHNWLLLIFFLFTAHYADAQHSAKVFKMEHFYLEPNVGQLGEKDGTPIKDVKYFGSDDRSGVDLYLKSTEIAFVFVKKSFDAAPVDKSARPGRMPFTNSDVQVEAQRMEMHFIGANSKSKIVPQQKQSYYRNYYLAHCRDGILNVPTYKEVIYKDLYPKIDLIIEISNTPGSKGMKYSFLVHPGGNPADIKIEWKGTQPQLAENGGIHYKNDIGFMNESKPLTFITAEGKNTEKIKSNFKVTGNEISFTIGSYQKNQSILIDPNISWGTYLGGSDVDMGIDNASGDSNTVYIGGYTQSSAGIATKGAFQTKFNFAQDGFISKFDSSGILMWSTYYGDISRDEIWGLATDDSSNVVGFGITASSAGIASKGSYQDTYGGGTNDAFVVKFDKKGARKWATYYGGSEQENVVKGCIDDSGNVILCGETFSDKNIATSGTYQTVYIGSGARNPDAYLVKFNRAGKRKWGTYFGGSLYDQIYGVVADKWGNLYCKLWEESTSNVATSGAYQTSFGGGSGDAGIAKFDGNGQLKWATYFGGTGDEGDGSLFGQLGTDGDVGVDDSGNVYIVTTTTSSGMATKGAYQTSINGGNDVILGKFDSAGKVKWITYYGGSNYDFGKRLFVNKYGVYIIGETTSSTDMATKGAYQSTIGGGRDAFYAKFDFNGNLQYGTYFGGSGNDFGGALTDDNFGSLYLVGVTASTSGIATKGGYQTSFGGGSYDAFLIKFTDSILWKGCEINGRILKNTSFEGKFGNGTKADPDVICPGTKAVYTLSSRFPDKEYGKSWSITSVSVKTVKGVNSKDTAYIKPSVNNKGKITFSPPSTQKADSFILTVNYKADTCKATVTRYILVSINPKASFTMNSSGCHDQVVKIKNTTTTSVGKLSYIWYYNGYTSTDENPSIIFNDSGTYTISLVASNGACQDSISKTIHVFPGSAGSSFLKGSPYSGLFNAGTERDPDQSCSNDTLTYRLSAPRYFKNSDYGTKWKVSSWSVITYTLKTPLKDTISIKPSGSNDFNLKLRVPKSYQDSILILSVTLRGIEGGCDTTIKRIIHVNKAPLPIADFSYSEVCEGLETTFNNLSDWNGNTYVGYVWEFGDGGSATVGYPSHTYSKAGTYEVRLIATSQSGCTDMAIKKVKVYSKPQMKIGTSPLCAGQSITFYDSSVTDGNVVKRYWVIDKYKSSLATPSYKFYNPGKIKVSLAIEVSTGCIDTLTQEFEILSPPKADFNFTASCIGDSSKFENTSTGSNNKYYWDFGDGTTSFDKSPSKVFFVGGTYSVSLRVVGPSGCEDVITKKVAPAANPVAKMSITTACAGSPASFSDQSNYGSKPLYTHWYFGDGSTDNKSTPTHTYKKAGSYTVTLAIKNDIGCTDSIFTLINIKDAPTADFTANTVCVGQPTAFTNNSKGSGGAIKYAWDFGDTTTSKVESPTHTYKRAGTYTVKLTTDEEGCISTKISNVTVNSGPVPKWTYTNVGKKVNFTPNSTTFTSYQWIFGDGDSSTSSAPMHLYPSSTGIYVVTLKVKDAQGCEGQYTDTVNLSTSIENAEVNIWNVKVFPNPFTGKTTISYTLQKRSNVSITITDMQGREIETAQNAEMKNAGRYEKLIATDHLPAGIYLLKMKVDDDYYHTTIVKQK